MARALLSVFFTRRTKPTEVVEQAVRISRISRREGILAVQDEMPPDPFMTEGLQLAADGTEPDLIMDILETELMFVEERHQQVHRVLEMLARNWLIFAAIGVTLALITRADDGLNGMELVRRAAYPAFQGLLLAGLIARPLAQKLTELHHVEVLTIRMAIEAVMAIQSGDDPRIVQHKLSVFLAPSDRPSGDHEAEESAPQAAPSDEDGTAAATPPAEEDQGTASGAAAPGLAADFGFNDFTSVPDRAIQVFLRAVDGSDLAVGLKGASAEVREKFLQNTSERGRAMMLDEIGLVTADPDAVSETQSRIVQHLRRMVDDRHISLA